MKKAFIIIGVIVCSLIVVANISYGLVSNNEEDIDYKNSYTKEELYQIIIDKSINYKDKKQVNILCNWYSFFDREEMFLTYEGEFVDYVTYEIYRVHLENIYNNDNKKVLKKLLRYNNFPKQENSEKYDEYVNEYKKTTGKDI